MDKIKTITVAKGDTLFQIAKDNNTTVNELLKLNKDIKDPNLILVGQKINVEEMDFGGNEQVNTQNDVPTPNINSADDYNNYFNKDDSSSETANNSVIVPGEEVSTTSVESQPSGEIASIDNPLTSSERIVPETLNITPEESTIEESNTSDEIAKIENYEFETTSNDNTNENLVEQTESEEVEDDLNTGEIESIEQPDYNEVEEDIEISLDSVPLVPGEEAPAPQFYGENDEAIISKIQSLHDEHLSVSDYKHNCGYLVSDQLALLGLTDRELTKFGSGKYFAKSLAESKATIDGHVTVGYESNSSNQREVFEDILNSNGGNLSNLVISFNRGGSFSSTHGHVMLINKIENGRVYFVDDWKKYRDNSKNGYNATSMTVEEFEDQYLKSSNNSNYMTHII